MKEIATALAKFQAEIKDPEIDSKNPHFGNEFSSLSSCFRAIRPVMAKYGLSVTQIPDTVMSQTGPHMILRTVILHSSGEKIEGNYILNPVKNDPQGMGSAITYAKRYALKAMLGLGDEDDDGQQASQPKKQESKKEDPLSIGTENYVIPFGKFKNKALSECKLGELEGYCTYLKEAAAKEGKPIRGQVQDFINRVNKYADEKTGNIIL